MILNEYLQEPPELVQMRRGHNPALRSPNKSTCERRPGLRAGNPPLWVPGGVWFFENHDTEFELCWFGGQPELEPRQLQKHICYYTTTTTHTILLQHHHTQLVHTIFLHHTHIITTPAPHTNTSITPRSSPKVKSQDQFPTKLGATQRQLSKACWPSALQRL